MPLVLLCLSEKIIDYSSIVVRGVVAVLLSTFVLSGCQTSDSSREVPGTVTEGLHILGPDRALTGGIQASEFYRSFFSQFEIRLQEEGLSTESFTEHHRRTIQQLGLDPLEDDVTVLVAIDRLDKSASPGLVVLAPFSSGRLASLADELEFFDRLEVTLPGTDSGASGGELPVYALKDGDETLLVAQPEANVLVATSSIPQMAAMILRSRDRTAESVDSYSGQILDAVAGEDAWFISEDIRSVFESFPSQGTPADITQILRAIDRVAGSVRLGAEEATFTLFMKPASGVAVSDLADLVRGVIAVGKLNEGSPPVIAEIVNRIEVSEIRGMTRVRLNVSETLLEELASGLRSK